MQQHGDAVELTDTKQSSGTQSHSNDDEKALHVAEGSSEFLPAYSEEGGHAPISTAKDLVTQVIHVEDDPTLNPWTFRMWFLGASAS